jgi:tetratricopeptide (TPR) repeat protein
MRSAEKGRELAGRAGRSKRSPWVCWRVLVISLLLIVPVRHTIDRRLSSAEPFAEVLNLPSGAVLRHLSLGNEGLLADIYWTRAIQYFGRQRLDRANEFPLLGPLLRITTDLDPQLLVAYRYGAVFLADKPPQGAGRPDQALRLLMKGIAANPEYWRFWQDVGFIYYWDLRDYQRAARAFEAGSRMPGALAWMKTMAATVLARGGDLETSRQLWLEVYQHPGNEQVRKSAGDHLAALDAQIGIERLNALLARYREREGHPAASFRELVAQRYLAAQPLDPTGVPFAVGSDGRARLGPESKIDLKLSE